ncbi:MAG TPA: phosphate ABC transporter substrate-binding protein PstS [Candidatus Polarisedimenticolia bacterium]|nr:phosphate ABC transporter substrate-binding protein PstS [Candidatus Polarisedimenticolia bacterium]
MRTRSSRLPAIFLGWILLLPAATRGQEKTVLVETGSSMPEPLYKSWADEFHVQQPSTDIRYMAVGTAESARNILAGSGDFGGGDAPIPEVQLRASGKSILELPAVLIGIVIIYELPDVKGELKLTGPVLANIFLGKIKSWNDPAIAKLNPDMKLPELPIQVLHRNDGKGSNYILSDYLAKVSPEFLSTAGRSESPKWPVGQAFQRSQDLVAKLRGTPGAIGYTELNIAAGSAVRIASIKNAAGEFVKPSAKSIAAAATASGSKMNNDFRVSLTNAPGKESYSISSFTWLYVPAVAKDPGRGSSVASYLKWVYTSGQKIAQEKGYAILPSEVLEKVMAKAASVR